MHTTFSSSDIAYALEHVASIQRLTAEGLVAEHVWNTECHDASTLTSSWLRRIHDFVSDVNAPPSLMEWANGLPETIARALDACSRGPEYNDGAPESVRAVLAALYGRLIDLGVDITLPAPDAQALRDTLSELRGVLAALQNGRPVDHEALRRATLAWTNPLPHLGIVPGPLDIRIARGVGA